MCSACNAVSSRMPSGSNARLQHSLRSSMRRATRRLRDADRRTSRVHSHRSSVCSAVIRPMLSGNAVRVVQRPKRSVCSPARPLRDLGSTALLTMAALSLSGTISRQSRMWSWGILCSWCPCLALRTTSPSSMVCRCTARMDTNPMSAANSALAVARHHARHDVRTDMLCSAVSPAHPARWNGLPMVLWQHIDVVTGSPDLRITGSLPTCLADLKRAAVPRASS